LLPSASHPNSSFVFSQFLKIASQSARSIMISLDWARCYLRPSCFHGIQSASTSCPRDFFGFLKFSVCSLEISLVSLTSGPRTLHIAFFHRYTCSNLLPLFCSCKQV
jgi:hypothetical protein